MGEFALPPMYTATPHVQAAPTSDTHVLAVERRDDPLDLGFVLCDGLLVPLPPKVRLPHDETEADEELEPA